MRRQFCAISGITLTYQPNSSLVWNMRSLIKDDTRTVYAVIRCLEIISEASRRLPTDLKARYPSIAWKEMAGAGNIYRHEYEDVAAKLVWDTVQLALPPLRDVVASEIARL
jgi:uncharacterized protein with HEPN domain